MKKFYLILLFAVLLTCQRDKSPAQPSSETPKISYGTSFGECLGYCYRELVIDNGHATLTESSWQPVLPDLTYEEKLSASEWYGLLQEINWADFQKQPDIIGCPDCTDSGAEWIEIEYPEAVKNVLFEYGQSIKGHEDLLKKLRTIFSRMEAKIAEDQQPIL